MGAQVVSVCLEERAPQPFDFSAFKIAPICAMPKSSPGQRVK